MPCPAPVTLCSSSKECTTALECYLELSDKVRTGLAHIDPYFTKLADGMVAWLQCWQKMQEGTGAKSNGNAAAVV